MPFSFRPLSSFPVTNEYQFYGTSYRHTYTLHLIGAFFYNGTRFFFIYSVDNWWSLLWKERFFILVRFQPKWSKWNQMFVILEHFSLFCFFPCFFLTSYTLTLVFVCLFVCWVIWNGHLAAWLIDCLV